MKKKNYVPSQTAEKQFFDRQSYIFAMFGNVYWCGAVSGVVFDAKM